jgi:hypothetical protein
LPRSPRWAPLPLVRARTFQAADKLLLQSNVKQRSIELREKELKLFNSNFSAVGTQSAIMAGFTLTSFVEIDLPPDKEYAKSSLHFFITMSICINFITVAMVTFVTVWGGGKALRGQDGSMDYAVDEMNRVGCRRRRRCRPVRLPPTSAVLAARLQATVLLTRLPWRTWCCVTQERSFIFGCFGVGILATLGCLLSAAHVLMEPEVAAVASCLILSTVYLVISEARRIQKRFFLEEDEIVSFEELRNIYPEIAPLAKGGAQSTYSGVGTPTCSRGSTSGELRSAGPSPADLRFHLQDSGTKVAWP